MMGISALSFAGMKKKASTTTRAAMTICAIADNFARRSPEGGCEHEQSRIGRARHCTVSRQRY